MRILYYQPLCPFSRKIRFILAEKKLDYELKVEPFWEKKKELFDLNPAFTIPVLLDLNNTVIADSYAIQEYLEDIYPTPMLFDESPKVNAEIRRILSWFDFKFAQEVSLPIVNEKVFKRYQRSAIPDSQKIREAQKNIILHLEYIGWLVERRNWLAGNQFSVADIAASAHLSAIDYFGDVPWKVSIDAKNWYMRIKSRPTFQVLLRDRSPGIPPAKHFADLDF